MSSDDLFEVRKPPALDWGPFSVGMFMALVFLALAFLPAVFLGLSAWDIVTGLIAGIIAALCTTSAIGVLYAKRRVWDSEQRQAYITKHGNLSND